MHDPLPVWRAGTPCPYPHYERFKTLLDDASYHFADDSGSEWALGLEKVQIAADYVAQMRYPYHAIKMMVHEAKSLVTADMVLHRVIEGLYRKADQWYQKNAVDIDRV